MQSDHTTDVPLCACGCNEPVTWSVRRKRWNKFIHRHTLPFTAERLWAKVDNVGECWEWTGALSPDGYGFTYVPVATQRAMGCGSRVSAHRLAYLFTYGPIPDSMLVCHHCDNPKCVRPDHLFLGTDGDNMRDMVKKGRVARPMAKLSLQQVLLIRHMCERLNVAQVVVAKWFDMSPVAIGQIVRRKRWQL